MKGEPESKSTRASPPRKDSDDTAEGNGSGIDNVGWLTLLKRYAVRTVLAIGASLGVGGLVAVLGAGVLYARFYFAEIPADQALAALENNELVVFGAVSLVLFVPAPVHRTLVR